MRKPTCVNSWLGQDENNSARHFTVYSSRLGTDKLCTQCLVSPLSQIILRWEVNGMIIELGLHFQTRSESERRDEMKDRQEVLEWMLDDSGNNRDVISLLLDHRSHLSCASDVIPQPSLWQNSQTSGVFVLNVDNASWNKTLCSWTVSWWELRALASRAHCC